MRLITFEDPVRQFRIGALTADGRVVDLHSACALYLRDVENESAFDRLADALVPPNMRDLFSGGDTSLEAARKELSRLRSSPGSFFIPRAIFVSTMRKPPRPDSRIP